VQPGRGQQGATEDRRRQEKAGEGWRRKVSKASRARRPQMRSSADSLGEDALGEERRAACDSHALEVEYSDATYHGGAALMDASAMQPTHHAAPSDSAHWHCYAFPGAGCTSRLGVDATAPAGFAEDELARVSRQPVLSAMQCSAIIDEAERLDAWEDSGRIAHYARRAGCYTPLSALPQSRVMLAPFTSSVLFPAIKKAFPSGCCSASLRVRGGRLVKYNASALRTELGLHRDGPLMTASIALNSLAHYDGGGTRIEALTRASWHTANGVGRGLKDNGQDNGSFALRVDVGHAVVHPGCVRHGGELITRGVRYVLILFLFDASKADHDNYCLLKANGLLARALRITSGSAHRGELLHAATQAYRVAIALGSAHEAAHVGLGQAWLERARTTRDAADVKIAVDALTTAIALAPTHAHSQSTLRAALQLARELDGK